MQMMLGTWFNCQRKNGIPDRWVYKIKTVDSKPQVQSNAGCKSLCTTKRVDFHEAFSPVVKIIILQICFAISWQLFSWNFTRWM